MHNEYNHCIPLQSRIILYTNATLSNIMTAKKAFKRCIKHIKSTYRSTLCCNWEVVTFRLSKPCHLERKNRNIWTTLYRGKRRNASERSDVSKRRNARAKWPSTTDDGNMSKKRWVGKWTGEEARQRAWVGTPRPEFQTAKGKNCWAEFKRNLLFNFDKWPHLVSIAIPQYIFHWFVALFLCHRMIFMCIMSYATWSYFWHTVICDLVFKD